MKKKYFITLLLASVFVFSCKQKQEQNVLELLAKKAENIYIVKIEDDLWTPSGHLQKNNNKMDIVGNFFVKKKLKHTEPAEVFDPFGKTDEEKKRDLEDKKLGRERFIIETYKYKDGLPLICGGKYKMIFFGNSKNIGISPWFSFLEWNEQLEKEIISILN